MESVVRELAGAALVRVNPTDPDVPTDLPRAVGLAHGHEVLLRLAAEARAEQGGAAAQQAAAGRVEAERRWVHTIAGAGGESRAGRGGQLSWRQMVESLRR